MKLVIDNITDATGWTFSTNASIQQINTENLYIAGNNDSSVLFNINGANEYIQKTYGTDVTNYDTITLWVKSLKKSNQAYKTASNFSYKLDLGTDKEYYMQAYNDFYYITIDISDINTIDRLKITSLSTGQDYLILSYFVASKDVFPLDIFSGLKEQLEYERDNTIDLKLVNTGTGTTDDAFITVPEPVCYLDRYNVIKIDDGVNSEIHHITRKENNVLYFSNLYDGGTLLNDYTAANVYLYYPIEFGTAQKEIVFPSITFWGFAPERELITNELDHIIDTYKTDDTFGERKVGQFLNWDLLFDCVSGEEFEVLGELSQLVRKTIGKKKFWINGRKAFVDFTAKAVELYPTEAFDIIPKVQYPALVQIREDLYTRDYLAKTTSTDFTVTITEQGGLTT